MLLHANGSEMNDLLVEEHICLCIYTQWKTKTREKQKTSKIHTWLYKNLNKYFNKYKSVVNFVKTCENIKDDPR